MQNSAPDGSPVPRLSYGMKLWKEDDPKLPMLPIKEYENQGISLSEMAILVRNNSQIQEISSFLKNRKIEAESGKHRSNIYNGMVAKRSIKV